MIPFCVLGFWDKNTGIYAGAMPFRRDSPATTVPESRHSKHKRHDSAYNLILNVEYEYHDHGCPHGPTPHGQSSMHATIANTTL